MDHHEFTAALNRMGLSVTELAGEIGMHRATVFRYASGELEIPKRVELAVAALEAMRGGKRPKQRTPR